MEKLIRVDSEGVSQGISPAQRNTAIAAWKDAENIIFREKAVRPEPGQSSMFAKLADKPVIGMAQAERGGRPILFWGDRTKLFRGDPYASTPVTDVSDATYSGIAAQTNEKVATRWSMQSWGEWMVAANGIDELRAFKPGNATFHTLGHANIFGAGYQKPAEHVAAGKEFRPHFLVRAKSHILAFSHHIHATASTDNEISEGEQTFWWCDDNRLDIWLPAAGNAAGSSILRDAPSPLMTAKPFLDGAATFTLNTCHLIQYVGSPFWFVPIRTLQGIGAFGEAAVVPVGRQLFGAGPKGLWRCDGAEYQYLDHPKVRDWYLTQLNLEQASQIVAWHDPTHDRVVWFFPAAGAVEPSLAIAYDYTQGTFHRPKYIRSAASIPESFPYPVVGDLEGNIWRQSYADAPTSPTLNPVSFPATYTLTAGYGVGGYGLGGYGGVTEGNG